MSVGVGAVAGVAVPAGGVVVSVAGLAFPGAGVAVPEASVAVSATGVAVRVTGTAISAVEDVVPVRRSFVQERFLEMGGADLAAGVMMRFDY